MDTNADDDEDSFSSVDEYRREEDDAVFDEDVGGAKATTQDETDAAAVSANRADDIFTMMRCYRDWMEECVPLPEVNDAEKKMRTRTISTYVGTLYRVKESEAQNGRENTSFLGREFWTT